MPHCPVNSHRGPGRGGPWGKGARKEQLKDLKKSGLSFKDQTIGQKTLIKAKKTYKMQKERVCYLGNLYCTNRSPWVPHCLQLGNVENFTSQGCYNAYNTKEGVDVFHFTRKMEQQQKPQFLHTENLGKFTQLITLPTNDKLHTQQNTKLHLL